MPGCTLPGSATRSRATTLYGSGADPIRRLALHARSLAFDHPRTAARMRFASEPPAELGQLGFRKAARTSGA